MVCPATWQDRENSTCTFTPSYTCTHTHIYTRACRWHMEQTRPADPNSSSVDKTDEAIAFLHAGGGAGWNMQVHTLCAVCVCPILLIPCHVYGHASLTNGKNFKIGCVGHPWENCLQCCTRPLARTCTHACTQTHTHSETITHAYTLPKTITPTHTHRIPTHTHTLVLVDQPSNHRHPLCDAVKLAYTCARTHTHTHIHTHAHAYIHVCRLIGLAAALRATSLRCKAWAPCLAWAACSPTKCCWMKTRSPLPSKVSILQHKSSSFSTVVHSLCIDSAECLSV